MPSRISKCQKQEMYLRPIGLYFAAMRHEVLRVKMEKNILNWVYLALEVNCGVSSGLTNMRVIK